MAAGDGGPESGLTDGLDRGSRGNSCMPGPKLDTGSGRDGPTCRRDAEVAAMRIAAGMWMSGGPSNAGASAPTYVSGSRQRVSCAVGT